MEDEEEEFEEAEEEMRELDDSGLTQRPVTKITYFAGDHGLEEGDDVTHVA